MGKENKARRAKTDASTGRRGEGEKGKRGAVCESEGGMMREGRKRIKMNNRIQHSEETEWKEMNNHRLTTHKTQI